MSNKCPACHQGTHIYKCERCGELRCDASTCPGTFQSKKGNASPNRKCLSCGKGNYERI